MNRLNNTNKIFFFFIILVFTFLLQNATKQFYAVSYELCRPDWEECRCCTTGDIDDFLCRNVNCCEAYDGTPCDCSRQVSIPDGCTTWGTSAPGWTIPTQRFRTEYITCRNDNDRMCRDNNSRTARYCNINGNVITATANYNCTLNPHLEELNRTDGYRNMDERLYEPDDTRTFSCPANINGYLKVRRWWNNASAPAGMYDAQYYTPAPFDRPEHIATDQWWTAHYSGYIYIPAGWRRIQAWGAEDWIAECRQFCQGRPFVNCGTNYSACGLPTERFTIYLGYSNVDSNTIAPSGQILPNGNMSGMTSIEVTGGRNYFQKYFQEGWYPLLIDYRHTGTYTNSIQEVDDESRMRTSTSSDGSTWSGWGDFSAYQFNSCQPGPTLGPVCTGITGPASVNRSTPATFTANATDSDTPATNLRYTWSATCGTITSANPRTGNATMSWGSSTTPGTCTIGATVSDGTRTGVCPSLNVSVGNRPPATCNISDTFTEIYVGSSRTLTINGTDPDADQLSYVTSFNVSPQCGTLAPVSYSTVPSGANRTFTYTAPNTSRNGCTLTATIRDPYNATRTCSFNFDVKNREFNWFIGVDGDIFSGDRTDMRIGLTSSDSFSTSSRFIGRDYASVFGRGAFDVVRYLSNNATQNAEVDTNKSNFIVRYSTDNSNNYWKDFPDTFTDSSSIPSCSVSGGIYILDAGAVCKIGVGNNGLAANVYRVTVPGSDTTASNDVAYIIDVGTSGDLVFSTDFKPAGNGYGRAVLITQRNVIIRKDVGYANWNALDFRFNIPTLAPDLNKDMKPNIAASIITTGNIVVESSGDPSTEKVLYVDGPLVAKGRIQMNRFPYNNAPGMIVRYLPWYLTRMANQGSSIMLDYGILDSEIKWVGEN